MLGGVRITPERNCLAREDALRMLTENVTWFSDEEGKKGRIEAGLFADLMVCDRDLFRCAEDEISDITSVPTVVCGKVVWAAGDFIHHDTSGPPPAMPDWSPVRRWGGYGAWAEGKPFQAAMQPSCGCAKACGVHGHAHGKAWASEAPTSDLQGFWGALGCACWAV